MSLVLNILWFVLGGFLVVFAYVFGGLLLCITIIGIPLAFFAVTIIGLPFAAQHLKMTRLAILPYGFRVVASTSASAVF